MSDSPEADPQALRAELDREIARLAAQAGRKAMAGEPDGGEAARIESLQKIAAALPAPPNRVLALAILIGAVCLIAVSLAWTMRVWTTRVQLELVTSTVHLRLTEDFAWSGDLRLKPAEVRLANFSSFDLPNQYGAPPPIAPGSTLDLLAPEGEMHLTSFFAGAGALLTVARNATGAVDFDVRDAPFRGDLDVVGDVIVQAKPPPTKPFEQRSFIKAEPPGRFGFQFSGRGAVPALLHETPIDLPGFQDIAVRGLGFFDERDEASRPAFASQIVSGTLVMTDTDEHVTLNQGAALRLAEASGLVSTLKVTDKGIALAFEGTARGVTLGSRDFARNLKPTWLEWLFHQQKLGFLWTALTFLFGLGWSARKLMAGGS